MQHRIGVVLGLFSLVLIVMIITGRYHRAATEPGMPVYHGYISDMSYEVNEWNDTTVVLQITGDHVLHSNASNPWCTSATTQETRTVRNGTAVDFQLNDVGNDVIIVKYYP